MPILTFDRVLKIISMILNILAAALGALQGVDATDKTAGEAE